MPDTSPRARTSGPQTQRKRPGDLTGVQGQRLAKERDDAKLAAAAESAQDHAADRAELLSTVVDYTQGGVRHDVEVIETEPEVLPKEMLIRVNYPIENMTFGREVVSPPEYDENGVCTKPAVLGGMQTYDFVEGQQYRVPWELGAHLKGLGYVYDF